MQRNSVPMTWRPKGLSDTLDASDNFPGAMALLTNLIPDPSTNGLWQCRPAATKKIDFVAGGFVNPRFVSVYYTNLGNFVYGMIASSRNPGHDEPFCYNLLTSSFVAVTGITAVNTPTNPLASGTWSPPTMELIGAKLIVTHPGFNGAGGNYFGWFDVSVPGTPTWNAGNLTGLVQFTVAPSGVAQFNGRAYYIHNAMAQPAVIFSDALNATNVTNANQILTFDDSVRLTAIGPLSFRTQLGGIVQALIVFKGATNMYQITGDPVFNNLSRDALNVATGTFAPNTVVPTPKGLAFISPEGLRIIDYNAQVSDPIGVDGKGVAVPFIYAVTPSRMAAACGGNILRVTTQNGNMAGAPNQEYWFDFARGIWSGPHTFPASFARSLASSFLLAPVGVLGALWQSDVVQSITSTFVENGQQLTFDWRCALLPDTEKLTENSMTEASLDVGLIAGSPAFTVKALTQAGSVLDTVSIAATGQATLWGHFQWGHALWGGSPNRLAPRQLSWHQPIVFARLQIDVTGQSAQYVKIGTLRMRYQVLRYIVNTLASAA